MSAAAYMQRTREAYADPHAFEAFGPRRSSVIVSKLQRLSVEIACKGVCRYASDPEPGGCPRCNNAAKLCELLDELEDVL